MPGLTFEQHLPNFSKAVTFGYVQVKLQFLITILISKFKGAKKIQATVLVVRLLVYHCDLFSEFWFSDSFRGYTAHI